MILKNAPQINIEQPRNVNTKPVGFGNTRISTDKALKSPEFGHVALEWIVAK